MTELRLPLPIACLRTRSRNSRSKNPKDAHDGALFAWEASLRLAVALHPPESLAPLRRASFGEWARATSVPDVQLEDGRLLELFTLAARVGRDEGTQRKAVRPRELFEALAAYRNQAHGHALKEPSFYREAGPLLLDALEAAWQAELFLPRAGMLVYVEGVALEPHGARKGHVLELEGEAAFKSAPLGIAVPASVLPRRVYWREGERWSALHPWLAYDDEQGQGRIYFFDKLDRKAHYLDFVSGSPPRQELSSAFEPDVLALFESSGGRSAARVAAPDAESETQRAQDPSAFGEFSIVGRLGAGGMGEVFLARQASLDRLVALKMLPPSLSADPVARARFQREVLALSRCEHPHVVKILSSGTTRGTPWYAMEYVEGADLVAVGKALSSGSDFDGAVSTACAATKAERAELFPYAPPVERVTPATANGRARWQDLARFFRDAALGVQHLHERGVLHRDIKPGNLMVTAADHRAVVMDLGLAAVESATLSLSHDKSKVLGTLRYMAPEQLQRSLREVDERADVYGLGATLYELLTDKPFFDGESEQRLIKQVLDEEPIAPRRLVPAIPADLDLIVCKATEKNPALRYHGAKSLAEDLDAFLAGGVIQARAKSFAYQLRRQIRRHKELFAAALLLVLGVIAGVAFYLNRLEREVAEQRIQIRLLQASSEVAGLEAQAERHLWPMCLETISAMREWLHRADELRKLFREHTAWLRDRELEVDLAKCEAFFQGPAELPDGLAGALGTSLAAVRRRLDLVDQWHVRTVTSDEAQQLWREVGIAPREHLLPLSKNPQGLWELWHVPSGERPKPVEPKPEREDANRWVIEPETGLVFVLIPGGVFWQGAQKVDPEIPNYDPDAEKDDGPPHEVRLEAYFLSKYEMTVAQWVRLTGNAGASEATTPKSSVSWFDFEGLEGRFALRLPTESQWEHGCRGRTTTPWWTGSDPATLERAAALGEEMQPVGSVRANPFGLHDVHGNAWEWCENAYALYGSDVSGDTSSIPRRVVRGGGWSDDASYCRSANRGAIEPGLASSDLGFRPALAVRSAPGVRNHALERR